MLESGECSYEPIEKINQLGRRSAAWSGSYFDIWVSMVFQADQGKRCETFPLGTSVQMEAKFVDRVDAMAVS